MCGICGIAYKDPRQPADQTILRKMTDVLAHRGPDGEGYYAAPGIGLGFRRLSIIDLASGDQPICNENGSIALVCNGEIYNYIELRNDLQKKGHRFRTHSDVEVIAHLYEDHGVACLSRLRGMFAFALWDADQQTLFLARDRLGIKPLSWAVGRDGALYFASECKSILAGGQVACCVDVSALRNLFTSFYVLAPKTIIEGIREIPAGHYALCRRGNLEVKPYWDISFTRTREKDLRRNPDQWADLLYEKLKETVRIHMRSDVPVGAWLSAGLDSSAIAALMSRMADHPLNTYSLSFPDQPRFDEVGRLKTLNEFEGYNLQNRLVPCHDGHFDWFAKVLWHQENPSSSGNHILQYLLARESSESVKVVLSGEGADEIFGGYPWYLYDKLARPFNQLPVGVQDLVTPMLPIPRLWRLRLKKLAQVPVAMGMERFAALVSRTERDLFDRVVSEDLKRSAGSGDDNENEFRYPEDYYRWTAFEQMQYLEIKTRMHDYILHSLDRSSMAQSLEARVPFLDHELVELCAGIPPALKMRGWREKYILRRALESVLPGEILARRKRGLMAPSGAWLKRRDLPWVDDMLSPGAVRSKGYFNAAEVTRILEAHRSGKRDCASVLMSILSVQVWDDLFVKGFRT